MVFDSFVGIPWGERGRTVEAADCWGLAWLVYQAHGIEIPSFADDYTNTADREHNAALINKGKPSWQSVPFSAERELDVILLTEAGIPCHVGIVARRGLMLHMVPGRSSVVESYLTGKLRHRLAGFYRYKVAA